VIGVVLMGGWYLTRGASSTEGAGPFVPTSTIDSPGEPTGPAPEVTSGESESPAPSVGTTVPPTDTGPVIGATTMRTVFTIDGVEVGSGFVDLGSGDLLIQTAAPFLFAGVTTLDAVEVRSAAGVTVWSVPSTVAASTGVATSWIELFAATSMTDSSPTPLAQVFVANAGARLAAVTAGTSGAEPSFATEFIRGVQTTHRRETVDLDLARARLAGTSAEAAAIALHNEAAGNPLVVDVWRDVAGVPHRIVVPYPTADGVGYLMADLAEPGVSVDFALPPTEEITWTAARSSRQPVPGQDASSF